MNTEEAVLLLYPNAKPDYDFTIRDDSDGKGAYVDVWNVKDSTGAVVTKPTAADLQAAWDKQNPVKTPADLLKEAQYAKMQELISACNKVILGRFKSTVGTVTYEFSHDGEAQANFATAARAFDKAFTTSESWTAYDSTGKIYRVTLNAAEFDNVYKDKMLHVKSNVSKLRDTLEPKVIAALDVPAVNAIVW